MLLCPFFMFAPSGPSVLLRATGARTTIPQVSTVKGGAGAQLAVNSLNVSGLKCSECGVRGRADSLFLHPPSLVKKSQPYPMPFELDLLNPSQCTYLSLF